MDPYNLGMGMGMGSGFGGDIMLQGSRLGGGGSVYGMGMGSINPTAGKRSVSGCAMAALCCVVECYPCRARRDIVGISTATAFYWSIADTS